MCKVLDEIEKKCELKIFDNLVKKGLLTLKQAAEELGMTPKKLEVAIIYPLQKTVKAPSQQETPEQHRQKPPIFYNA